MHSKLQSLTTAARSCLAAETPPTRESDDREVVVQQPEHGSGLLAHQLRNQTKNAPGSALLPIYPFETDRKEEQFLTVPFADRGTGPESRPAPVLIPRAGSPE